MDFRKRQRIRQRFCSNKWGGQFETWDFKNKVIGTF